MKRPFIRTQELFVIASGFGVGAVLQALVILYICGVLQSGLSNFVAAIVSR